MKYLALILLFIPSILLAEARITRPYPTLEEIDGSPSLRYPVIKVPNGSLTDNTTYMTLNITGSGGGGGSSSLEVIVNGVQTSSPTGTIIFSSAFTGGNPAASTTTLGINPSSATLQGNTSTFVDIGTRLDRLNFSTNTIYNQINSTYSALQATAANITANYLTRAEGFTAINSTNTNAYAIVNSTYNNLLGLIQTTAADVTANYLTRTEGFSAINSTQANLISVIATSTGNKAIALDVADSTNSLLNVIKATAADVSANYLDKSSATSTYLQKSSATDNYLLKGRDRDPWVVVITSGASWNGLSIPVFTAPLNSAITINTIRAESLGSATTVQYQLNERAYGTINTAGSNVFSVAFSTARNNGLETTSFNDASIAAGASLVLTTPSSSASAGNPTSIKVTIYYRKDSE